MKKEQAGDEGINSGAIILGLVVLFGVVVWAQKAYRDPGPLGAPLAFQVERGEGFGSVANRLAERTLGWAESAGDTAWYDADRDTGVGTAGQSVSMLAVEMLFRERQSIAPGSHCI